MAKFIQEIDANQILTQNLSTTNLILEVISINNTNEILFMKGYFKSEYNHLFLPQVNLIKNFEFENFHK